MLRSQTPDSMIKFMLIPTDGYFLEKEVFKDREGNKFTLEQKIEVKGIILDQRPALKKARKADGLRFDSLEYKDGYSRYKKQRVVFEGGFPLSGKRQINKILKTGNVYSFQHEAHGWTLIEKYQVIPGEFSVRKIHVTKLEFYTGEISGGCTTLTKKEYEQYRRKGMPQSRYDDMITDFDFSGPILSDHSSLTVNGHEYDDFYPHLEKLYSESKQRICDQSASSDRRKQKSCPSEKGGGRKKEMSRTYLFVHSEWIKRSFYELEIYEPFDVNKLRVEVSAELLHPKANIDYIFDLFYETEEGDLIEFKFIENFGSNSVSVDLYNARGKSVNFEILDDEYQD